jgi:aspartate/methionine/tyrosine aminotransferase
VIPVPIDIPPFKLERFFAPYEFNARYLLGSSDCQSMTIGQLLSLEAGAREAFEQHWLGYTEYEGAPELRAQIAALYEGIAPSQVLVFTGAEEAIFTFMNTAVSAGDHMIVHTPGYQSLYEVARGRGVQVSFWPAQEADGWALDIEWLRDHLQANTRAVVINCPHNPTGYLMSQTDYQALIDILRPRGIFLFNDEVYRGLEHDPALRLPAACEAYEYGFSLGVMSKVYGLAGLRIGWIATRNAATFKEMASFKDYTTICNSAPSEFLSALALRHHQKLVGDNLAIIKANLVHLDIFFAQYQHRFQWVRPSAGPIAFPRILFDAEIEAFCVDLVEQQGVMLLPGTCFFHGHQHFRIGFGRTNMPEALAQFDAYLVKNGLG